MSPRFAVMLVLLFALGCSGKKNSGPGSGPGERDPQEEDRMRMQLVADGLTERYGAVIEKRKDDKWDVNLMTQLADDNTVAVLDGLTPIAELDLSGSRITDLATLRLCKYTQLERLVFLGTSISDNGLKQLKPLQELRILGVGPLTTDQGLGIVTDFQKLQTLALTRSAITDEGLKQLKKLPKLEGLSLTSTRITDAGLAVLAELPTLRNIDLILTPITDNGLKHLAALPALETLDVRSTQITDAGLKTLEGMKPLKTLFVHGPKVTKEGIEAFRKARPDVTVTTSPAGQRGR